MPITAATAFDDGGGGGGGGFAGPLVPAACTF